MNCFDFVLSFAMICDGLRVKVLIYVNLPLHQTLMTGFARNVVFNSVYSKCKYFILIGCWSLCCCTTHTLNNFVMTLSWINIWSVVLDAFQATMVCVNAPKLDNSVLPQVAHRSRIKCEFTFILFGMYIVEYHESSRKGFVFRFWVFLISAAENGNMKCFIRLITSS